jgi:CRP/FNR family transcriptional regulator, cyclic AMP receptor protein
MAIDKRVRLVLGRSLYFRPLPADTLDRLAAMATVVRLKDAELIRRSPRPHDRLWLVLKGALRLRVGLQDGSAFDFAVLGEGSYFGIEALFTEGIRTLSEAYAIGRTDLAYVTYGRLRAELAGDRALQSHLHLLNFTRLRAALMNYRDAVALSLPQRIARRLLSQALPSGMTDGSVDVEVRIPQGDLAAMLGASRSKVSGKLQELQKKGLVRLGYRCVVLRDMARLSAFAGSDVMPL